MKNGAPSKNHWSDRKKNDPSSADPALLYWNDADDRLVRDAPSPAAPVETMRMSDEQLLTEFRSRANPRAFERIVALHGPMVLRVCRDVLGDPHAAEDAFQATFLVLARRSDRIRDPSRLGRWLYGVARRVSVRARVQERRRTSRTTAEVPVEVLPMRSAAYAARRLLPMFASTGTSMLRGA